MCARSGCCARRSADSCKALRDTLAPFPDMSVARLQCAAQRLSHVRVCVSFFQIFPVIDYYKILSRGCQCHTGGPGLSYMFFCWLVAKLSLTLRNPMDCSPPGSSVHGISQATILAWVAISFSGFMDSGVYMLLPNSPLTPRPPPPPVTMSSFLSVSLFCKQTHVYLFFSIPHTSGILTLVFL